MERITPPHFYITQPADKESGSTHTVCRYRNAGYYGYDDGQRVNDRDVE